MATEAQKRAIAKYDAENTTRISMKLNNKTDADILQKLAEVESKQGYIKELIRKDLQKQTAKNPLTEANLQGEFSARFQGETFN